MRQLGQVVLWLLASFTLPIAIAVMTDQLVVATRALRFSLEHSPGTLATHPQDFTCQTIVADPNPPLNVRSSPIVAPDNKLATLPNGTAILVVDEQDGWLRINTPLQGWVYKELTVTSCMRPTDVLTSQAQATPTGPQDEGAQLLAIATEQYQSGNLNGAVTLIKTIPAVSASHLPAQLLLRQWQQDWQEAEANFYAAQKAFREKRWQDVLHQVQGYPDIRYWRERLAPLVQQAMKQQAKSSKPSATARSPVPKPAPTTPAVSPAPSSPDVANVNDPPAQ